MVPFGDRPPQCGHGRQREALSPCPHGGVSCPSGRSPQVVVHNGLRPVLPFYTRTWSTCIVCMKRKKRNVRKPAWMLGGSFKNETRRTIRGI